MKREIANTLRSIQSRLEQTDMQSGILNHRKAGILQACLIGIRMSEADVPENERYTTFGKLRETNPRVYNSYISMMQQTINEFGCTI